MGTSFVEYKELGFWSRDSFLASWLGTYWMKCKDYQSEKRGKSH